MKRILLGLCALLVWAQDAAAQYVSRYQTPSTTTESSHVVCAGGCGVTGFQVNTGASAVWVMVFDATSAPADGAVTPVKWYQVAANSTLGVSWDNPLQMAAGFTLVCSTAGPFTKTASATCTFSGDRR